MSTRTAERRATTHTRRATGHLAAARTRWRQLTTETERDTITATVRAIHTCTTNACREAHRSGSEDAHAIVVHADRIRLDADIYARTH